MAAPNQLARCRPTGVGGETKVIEIRLIPTALDGPQGPVPGIIEYIVVEGDIPPLLPVPLLDSLGAVMDLGQDEMTLRKLDAKVPLFRASSAGHRTARLGAVSPEVMMQAPSDLGAPWGVDVSQFILDTNDPSNFPTSMAPAVSAPAVTVATAAEQMLAFRCRSRSVTTSAPSSGLRPVREP